MEDKEKDELYQVIASKFFAYAYDKFQVEREVKEVISNHLADLLQKKGEELVKQILARVEEYKMPKEIKANGIGADYIFVYDLKKFCLPTPPEDNINK